MTEGCCKICGGTHLDIFAHTAKCEGCGVLLYWPYPKNDDDLLLEGDGKNWPREHALEWYSRSSFFNHINFTNMLRFAMDESFKRKKIDILDYGGGGGQFALICSSHFPETTTYVTDISDSSLLAEWKPLNTQIRFAEFANDQKKFDLIFLNDVFEHLSDPSVVLKQLSGKLKRDGKIFMDTPRQFWLYPVTKMLSKTLYTQVLKGTVSEGHLQIWSKKSFELIVSECGLSITKYRIESEYTMPADHYMKNMGIKNPVIKFGGRLFYKYSRYIAKNKILCLLSETKS